MEPFIDGGLFELLLLAFFAATINYIFLRKYLLIIYSIAAVATPVALFFVKDKTMAECFTAFCLFNSIILILIIWQQKTKEKTEKLIELPNPLKLKGTS